MPSKYVKKLVKENNKDEWCFDNDEELCDNSIKECKNWCFTDFQLNDWNKIYNEHECIVYVCFGNETCPKTGRKHIQGWFQFDKKKRFTAVKKLFPTINFRACRGSEQANEKYCTKEGDFTRLGEFTKQGGRVDVNENVERILQGQISVNELFKENPFLYHQYGRTFEKADEIRKSEITNYSTFDIDQFIIKPIPLKKKAIILWGKSGIGKTQYACAHFPNGYLFVRHLDDLKRFNNKVHSGIVFDDMDFKRLPRTSQIHLLDWDEDSSIHVRHHTAFIPKKTHKIFTTNEQDGEIFSFYGDGYEKGDEDVALTRRVDIIKLPKHKLYNEIENN